MNEALEQNHTWTNVQLNSEQEQSNKSPIEQENQETLNILTIE